MIFKYKNKKYNSEKIPFFIYFKDATGRKEFVTCVNNYHDFGSYAKIDCIHSLLAGKAIIKDKRTQLFFSISCKEEKKFIQKHVLSYLTEESNGILISPDDIDPENLRKWIEDRHDKLN